MTLQVGAVLGERYRVDDIIDSQRFFAAGSVVDSGERVLLVDIGELLADGLRRAVGVAHPGLATLRELVHADNLTVGVYSMMEGTSLAERVRDAGPLPEREVVRLGAELSDALFALHRRGAPHGGVRPESVMVTLEGTSGVGLAYAARPDDESAYIPPERRGLPASPVDDVWALAALLYFALTGQSVPAGGFKSSRHVRAVVSDLGLALLLARCLRTNLEERVSMIHPVKEALEGWTPQALPSANPDESIVGQLPPGSLMPVAPAADDEAPRHSLPPPLPTPPGAASAGKEQPPPADAGPEKAEAPAHAPASDDAPTWRAPALFVGVALVAAVAVVVGVTLAGGLGTGDDNEPVAERPPTPAGPAAASTDGDGAAAGEGAPSAARSGDVGDPDAGASASASVAPPGAPSAGVGAASSAAPAGDVGACVDRHLPPKTFRDRPELDWLCKEEDARKGALKFRGVVIVHRASPLPPAMKQWSRMKWYTLPAYGALRAACCGGARVSLPELEACPSMTDAANGLAASVLAGEPSASALDAYRKAIVCQGKFHRAAAYRQEAAPGGGEEAAFVDFAKAFAAAGE